jgi:hypothetical protein
MKGAVAAVSKGTAALFFAPAKRGRFSPDSRLPMLYFVKPIGFKVFQFKVSR